MGGAIWDWIDQSMYNYTKEGKRYLAYGGDFGDTPNDGQFVMNGIIFGDEQPKPQYYEVKKVYQYIGTTWKDAKTATWMCSIRTTTRMTSVVMLCHTC